MSTEPAPKKIANLTAFSSGAVWAIEREAGQILLDCIQALPSIEISAQREMPDRRLARPGATAVINVDGVIERSPGLATYYGFGCAATDIAENLAAAENDPLVRAIVLSMNSPGGAAEAVVELRDQIRNCSKPVYAYVPTKCMSAAYWLASAASEGIYGSRAALVGSIGAMSVLVDRSEAYAKNGLKVLVVASDKYKGMGAAGTEITAEVSAEVQRIVNSYTDLFVADIAETRGRTAEEWIDGRVYLAAEAVEKNLLDGIVSFETLMSGIISSTIERPQRREPKMDALDKMKTQVAAILGIDAESIRQQATAEALAGIETQAAADTEIRAVAASYLAIEAKATELAPYVTKNFLTKFTADAEETKMIEALSKAALFADGGKEGDTCKALSTLLDNAAFSGMRTQGVKLLGLQTGAEAAGDKELIASKAKRQAFSTLNRGR